MKGCPAEMTRVRLSGDVAAMTAVATTGQLHHLDFWTDLAGGRGCWRVWSAR